VRAFNFYTFGRFIHPLGDMVEGAPIRDNSAAYNIFNSVSAMAEYFELNPYCKKYHPSSGKKLRSMADKIKKEFLNHEENLVPPEVMDKYDAASFKESLEEFETLLEDELNRLSIVCCEDEQIGNFSVDKLLKGASNGYPQKARIRLTQPCCREIDESGRCLV